MHAGLCNVGLCTYSGPMINGNFCRYEADLLGDRIAIMAYEELHPVRPARQSFACVMRWIPFVLLEV